jgi:hypothetical protein
MGDKLKTIIRHDSSMIYLKKPASDNARWRI